MQPHQTQYAVQNERSLRDLQNARWRHSAAKLHENKEIGGEEGNESPFEGSFRAGGGMTL